MDPILRQLVHVFADEVREQAQKISELLVSMEKDPARIAPEIEELFRQAHSLKGSSSSLGVTELERLAHTLEDVLTPARRAHTPLEPEMVDLGLRAMDAAKLRADGLVADTSAGLAEVESVTALLGAIVQKRGAVPVAPPVLPPVEPQAAPEVPTPAETSTMRVAAKHLVAIERRVDELRTMRGRLETHASLAGTLLETLERIWQGARRQSSESAEALYQLLRLAGGLRRDLIDESLERALRDASRRTDKEVRLEFIGGDTNLDRRLLEQLKVPLVHVVRNAVDHGVEPNEVREAVGKPPATVYVSIEQRGREIIIQVRDDGRGIDLGAVRQKAVERGFLDQETARSLSDDAVYELLFRSGISTADSVTELSGRGVGLDVAREAVLKLHGRIEVASVIGQGTTFTLSLPLTVSASEVMVVEESGRLFGLPQSSLERILRVQADELVSTGRRLHLRVDDQSLPVARLAPLVALTERHEGSSRRTVAVVRAGTARLGVMCERFLGSYDLVLRPLPLELQTLPLLNAAAILPSGQPLFVLSVPELIAASDKVGAERTSAGGDRRETILIADDSITTRSLLRTALEASGFRVRTASDGDEALRLALSEPFDLVVSDVRMPRLDGFGLTDRLRSNPRTAQTPVVLFSSLDSDEDRRRGVACGAQAYLTKTAFDRGQLLDVVSSLIRGA